MGKLIGFCLMIALGAGAQAAQYEKLETLVGIGATLEKSASGDVRIIGLVPNAPAEKAGLLAGDLIAQVRASPFEAPVMVRDLPLASVVALIRGPVGAPVEITYVRGISDAIDVSIVRQEFEVNDGE